MACTLGMHKVELSTMAELCEPPLSHLVLGLVGCSFLANLLCVSKSSHAGCQGPLCPVWRLVLLLWLMPSVNGCGNK